MLTFLFCAAGTHAQINNGFGHKIPNFPRESFFVSPLVFYDLDTLSSRLDAFIEVPRANILFSKTRAGYTASFDITVTLYGADDKTVFQKSYAKNFSYSEKDFKTEEKKSEFYLYNYFLAPGEYKLETVLNDKNSKKEYRRTDEIKVKNFTGTPVTVSDIMLVSELNMTGEGEKEITPLISNNVFGHKDFYLFFEVYNNTGTPLSGIFNYKITDRNDNPIKEGAISYSLTERKNSMFEKVSLDFMFREMYLPENMDPEEMGKKDFGIFKLTITDKASSTVVAEKKIIMLPDKPMVPRRGRDREH
ncbi:MAG: hypothetical protein LWX07_06790 [Bacteroidetes bacterium]|nr:hypothetical protein [Bacteroidota bacterium]